MYRLKHDACCLPVIRIVLKYMLYNYCPENLSLQVFYNNSLLRIQDSLRLIIINALFGGSWVTIIIMVDYKSL